MRVKTSCRKKVIVDADKENLDGTINAKLQDSQSIMERQKIPENINDYNTNSINEGENQNRDSTNLETLSNRQPITREAFDDHLLSSNTNTSQNNNMDSCFEDMNPKVDDSTSQSQDRNDTPHFADSVIISSDMQGNTDTDKDQLLVEVSKIIGVEKTHLMLIKKKTATATARSLIKLKYPNPNPNVGFSQADKSVVEAVLKYIRFTYPCDPTSDLELKKAMGNYFWSWTYKNKNKSVTVTNRIIEDVKNNNDDASRS